MKKKKTLSKLKQDVQKVFNKYIRLRDHGKPCISCGEHKTLQAGHYYNVRNYDAFRFNESNVHGECAGCNCFNESHLIGYGLNLEKKLGWDELDDLHCLVNDYKMDRNNLQYKWYRDDLEELLKLYKEKVKELEDC
jgi:hypothetical protein